MSNIKKFVLVSLILWGSFFIAPYIGYLVWGLCTVGWIMFCGAYLVAKLDGQSW